MHSKNLIGSRLTVIMSGESYMHVFYPMSSKFIYTARNYFRVLITIIGCGEWGERMLSSFHELSRLPQQRSSAGCLLSVMYPLNRFSTEMRDECNVTYMTVLMRQTGERVCQTRRALSHFPTLSRPLQHRQQYNIRWCGDAYALGALIVVDTWIRYDAKIFYYEVELRSEV